MTPFRAKLFLFMTLLACTFLMHLGWKTWLKTIPVSLPKVSEINNKNPNSLIIGSSYETSVPPLAKDKYTSASYRIWMPANIATIRGLILKQHGCGNSASSTGLNHANDLQWQALSLKYHFVLMGTNLSVNNRSCDDWALLNSGSENSFLKSLHYFAEKSHHPELDRVPWVLWGHSGGADWAAQMLQKYPERTIAAVLMRCGGITFPSIASNISVLKVPVLFAVAEKENVNASECRDLAKNTFFRYRQAGAIWGLASEADTGHESGDTRLLAIPYLDAVLEARLQQSNTNLQPINQSQGWLGNNTTHEISPANEYKGNPLEASLLLNKETAFKWQQYVTTNRMSRLGYYLCKVERFFIFKVMKYQTGDCYLNKILPSRKPAAPKNLRATMLRKSEVVLTWNFSPDLENGLPSFRIYRNNTLIKTLQGQRHNFGDAPEPIQVALEFHDQDQSGAIYAVSAFNDRGETMSDSFKLN